MVSCIKGEALEFYLNVTNPQMPYQMIIDKLREGYDTPHRKLSPQLEVDSVNQDEFIARHQIQYEKEYIGRKVVYLNNVTPQLVDGFHTEANKIRYLHYAILGKRWATTPLKNISTAEYNFDQPLLEKSESITLQQEFHKASTSSKANHPQLTMNLKDVRKYDPSHRTDSRYHGEYR